MRTFWIAACLVATTSAGARAQSYDDCEFRRELTGRIDMRGLQMLSVEAGAGSLTVRGVPGITEARVTGSACATSSDILDQLRIETRADGGEAVVATHFPERYPRNHHARIDLVIEVPHGTDARVHDGSGSADLSGLGELTVHDGSGGLTITDVAGTVEVTDGSGSVSISRAGGMVRIRDGSGSIRVRDAASSVLIADGSGSIDVRDIRGDFTLERDGSGSVDWARVEGRVDVPSRRRGRIR